MDQKNRAGDDGIQISFLVPIYNVKPFLADGIHSIEEACRELSYEIVCVEDCSTDGTGDVLRSLQRENPRIVVIQNEQNIGMCASRNRAMQAARGTYIWLFDPDDLVPPGIVTEFLRAASDFEADAVLGNYVRIREEASLSSVELSNDLPVQFRQVRLVDRDLPVDPEGNRFHSVCMGMFRRAFVEEHHLHFYKEMIAQEDTLFYYEYRQCGGKTIKTESVCYLYRQRNGSVMHDHSEKRNQAYYRSMRKMLEVFNDYLEKGTYTDLEELQRKILHTKENIAVRLALCKDHAFVKREFAEIQRIGAYPYAFRKATLKRARSPLYNYICYLMPIKPVFWIVHLFSGFMNV